MSDKTVKPSELEETHKRGYKTAELVHCYFDTTKAWNNKQKSLLASSKSFGNGLRPWRVWDLGEISLGRWGPIYYGCSYDDTDI